MTKLSKKDPMSTQNPASLWIAVTMTTLFNNIPKNDPRWANLMETAVILKLVSTFKLNTLLGFPRRKVNTEPILILDRSHHDDLTPEYS